MIRKLRPTLYAICALMLLAGCATIGTIPLREVKYDARVLWVVLQNYVDAHPQMTHAQLSRVSLEDLVKGGYLARHTLTGWQHRGMDISIHPENFRARGDGVVCQFNEGHSLVMATRTGEIRGIIQ